MTSNDAPGLPGHVYVELDWYDGPRAGISDFNGTPHRFESQSEPGGDYSEMYRLAPIDQETLDLEIEQYRIFVTWYQAFEANDATIDTHPAKGGIDRRWDELEQLLKDRRTIDPAVAVQARGTVEGVNAHKPYGHDGTSYAIRWEPM